MAISKRICALAVLAIIAATLMTALAQSETTDEARLMLAKPTGKRACRRGARHQPGPRTVTLRNAGERPDTSQVPLPGLREHRWASEQPPAPVSASRAGNRDAAREPTHGTSQESPNVVTRLWFPSTQSIIVMPGTEQAAMAALAGRLRAELGVDQVRQFGDQLAVIRALALSAEPRPACRAERKPERLATCFGPQAVVSGTRTAVSTHSVDPAVGGEAAGGKPGPHEEVVAAVIGVLDRLDETDADAAARERCRDQCRSIEVHRWWIVRAPVADDGSARISTDTWPSRRGDLYLAGASTVVGYEKSLRRIVPRNR